MRFNGLKSHLTLVLMLLAGCKGDPVSEIVCDTGYVFNEDSALCMLAIESTSCDADAERSIASECAQSNRECVKPGPGIDAECGTCIEGFKLEAEQCVVTLECNDLDCEDQSRACAEGEGNFDAQCTNCADPLIDIDGACIRINCERNAPGSMFDECEQVNRVCMQSADGAVCGACGEYYTEGDDGTCRQLNTCKEIECGNFDRECTPRTSTRDAECGACTSAFDDVDGTCVRRPPPVSCDDTIAGGTMTQFELCTTLNRGCAVINDEAACTACNDNFVESEGSEACFEVRSCAELGCVARFRDCTDGENAFCGRCQRGYTEDPETEECRPVVTCDELNCDALSVDCVGPAEGDENYLRVDAFCEVNCGLNAIYNGRRCAACPPCDQEGERGVSRHPTADGYCICNTTNGFYYSTSADIGTFPCDDDNDGWVRESARIALSSRDPVLNAAAQCNLKTIGSITLENEYGETKEIRLDEPVSLYESLRNDDDDLLQAFWQSYGLTPYLESRIQARFLNRFTKACHAVDVDYNDNGAADYKESKDQPRSATLLTEQQIFNDYSYFLELHSGGYEDAGDLGTYRIKERLRAGAEGTAARIKFSPDDANRDYWRSCTVLPDQGWDDEDARKVSMDLAGAEDVATGGTFRGMNHHSQFKCLLITDAPDDSVETELDSDEALAYSDGLTTCHPEPIDENIPAQEAVFECNPVDDPNASRQGLVAWGISPYRRYASQRDYKRGCVNECKYPDIYDRIAEDNEACQVRGQAAVRCFDDESNYGRFNQCEQAEVCDGVDNDLDQLIDEGLANFDGFTGACDTGLAGICGAGVKLCIPVNLETAGQCVPWALVGQGSQPQMSDPVLELCAGDYDATNPSPEYCLHQYLCNEGGARIGSDGHPLVSMLECRGPSVSTQINLRESCDQLDNDCDGVADEGPLFAPWDPNGQAIITDQPDAAAGNGGACDPLNRCAENELCFYEPVTCADSSECNAGKSCQNGACVDDCSAGNPCPSGAYCGNGRCLPGCTTNNPCPTDEVCNSDTRRCEVWCRFNHDCSNGQRCSDAGVCITQGRCVLEPDLNGQYGTDCTFVGDDVDDPALGLCAEGTWSCRQGGLSCVQRFPGTTVDRSGQAETGLAACDGVDSDCDGVIDETGEANKIITSPSQGAQCAPPYQRFHLDMDGDGFGDNNLAACACSEASARIVMQDYLASKYGFDNFNITNGRLLPAGFSGSWNLDFEGATPPRNGNLQTGRSLRSGPLVRLNGYQTGLEFKLSLGQAQDLNFDLKTRLAGNQVCVQVAYGANGAFSTKLCRTADQNWTTETTRLEANDIVRVRWVVIVRNGSFAFWQSAPGAAWVDNISFVSNPSLTLRTGDCCDRSRKVKPGQTTYYSEEMVCDEGLYKYDYDCNGSETLRYTEVDDRTEKPMLWPTPQRRVEWYWFWPVVTITWPATQQAWCATLDEQFSEGRGCIPVWQSAQAPRCGESDRFIWVWEASDLTWYNILFPYTGLPVAQGCK